MSSLPSRRASRLLVLLSLALPSLGCGGGEPASGSSAESATAAEGAPAPGSATAETSPAEGATEAPSDANPGSEAPATAAIALAQIGWSEDLRTIPDPAKAQNIAALALHRAEDFEGSLAGFEAALALAPNYLLARFNHVCALARLGRLEEASTELEALFLADLTEFGPRLETDADLATLRESPLGVALMRTRARILEAYTRAAAQGVPVTLYQAESMPVSASMQVVPGDYRAAAYLPAERRVVPLTPAISNTFGLVWSLPTQSVVILHGRMTSMMYELYPASFHVAVYSLASPGGLTASATNVEREFRRLFPAAYAANSGDAEAVDWEMAFATIGVRPLADGVELQVTTPDGQEMRLDIRNDSASVATEARSAPVHTLRPIQGSMGDSAMPEGFSMSGSSLTVPGQDTPIPLRGLRGWDQWLLDAEAQVLFVMSAENGCSGRFHRLQRVDLQSREVRELSRARVGGTLLRGGDGQIYVQIDADVKRLDAAGTLMDAGFPAWVKLVYPFPQSDCSM